MELRVLNLKENKEDLLFKSPECRQLLKMYEGFYAKVGFHLPWVGYLILRENHIVGSCGFARKPINGEVELAYWTFKQFERQGIASFACKELISIAQREIPDIKIIAKTAPEHNASTRILEKNGFQYSRVVQDEEIGDAWLWELK
jgi:RimJ/RimL family protein N-acetyltransferase